MNKPTVQLSGANGNTFSLLARCTQALKQAGQRDKADELRDKVFAAESYNQALVLIMEYCDVE